MKNSAKEKSDCEIQKITRSSTWSFGLHVNNAITNVVPRYLTFDSKAPISALNLSVIFACLCFSKSLLIKTIFLYNLKLKRALVER